MEVKENLIDPLLERAEAYSTTTFELVKLKFLAKTSDVLSMVIFHFLLVVLGSFFLLGITIAVSLWLGEIVGKSYLGFIIVAGFYGLLCGILFFIYPSIKTRIHNSVLSNMLD